MKISSRVKIIRQLSALLFMTLITTTSFASDISVSNALVRAVPEGMINSAAFMVLKNNSAQDRSIVSASSNISKVVELHTHTKEGGMMKMRQIDAIAIKSGSETILKPGGLHIMFIGLKHGLKMGDKVNLELVIDDGSKLDLIVPVKMIAGMHKKAMHK